MVSEKLKVPQLLEHVAGNPDGVCTKGRADVPGVLAWLFTAADKIVTFIVTEINAQGIWRARLAWFRRKLWGNSHRLCIYSLNVPSVVVACPPVFIEKKTQLGLLSSWATVYNQNRRDDDIQTKLTSSLYQNNFSSKNNFAFWWWTNGFKIIANQITTKSEIEFATHTNIWQCYQPGFLAFHN